MLETTTAKNLKDEPEKVSLKEAAEFFGMLGSLPVFKIKDPLLYTRLIIDHPNYVDVEEGQTVEFNNNQAIVSQGAYIYGCIGGVILIDGHYHLIHTRGGEITKEQMTLLTAQTAKGILGGNLTAFERLRLGNEEIKFIKTPEHEKPYLEGEASFQIAAVPSDSETLPAGFYFFYD